MDVDAKRRFAHLVIEYMSLVANSKNNITLQLAKAIRIINIRNWSMEGCLFRMDGNAKRRLAHARNPRKVLLKGSLGAYPPPPWALFWNLCPVWLKQALRLQNLDPFGLNRLDVLICWHVWLKHYSEHVFTQRTL